MKTTLKMKLTGQFNYIPSKNIIILALGARQRAKMLVLYKISLVSPSNSAKTTNVCKNLGMAFVHSSCVTIFFSHMLFNFPRVFYIYFHTNFSLIWF